MLVVAMLFFLQSSRPSDEHLRCAFCPRAFCSSHVPPGFLEMQNARFKKQNKSRRTTEEAKAAVGAAGEAAITAADEDDVDLPFLCPTCAGQHDTGKKGFMRRLYEFLRRRNTPLTKDKMPRVGKRELDLYLLYKEVTKRGGLENVCANGDCMSFTTNETASSCLVNLSPSFNVHFVSCLLLSFRLAVVIGDFCDWLERCDALSCIASFIQQHCISASHALHEIPAGL